MKSDENLRASSN
jgi:hypothetical protein